MNLENQINNPARNEVSIGAKTAGVPFSVGEGFEALSFRHSSFANGFDPLIMVDHYVMTESTFGAHPHAGLSAVSILFEDSVGKFHNTDSMGNDFDLQPGDLYWLKAGSGAVHDERPRPGAKIHGLQMFVNIPNKDKDAQPDSLLVKAGDMPVIEGKGARVRLVLGDYLDKQSALSPSVPMDILDGQLHLAGEFNYQIKPQHNVWIYAVSGAVTLQLGESELELQRGESIALENGVVEGSVNLINQGNENVRFVIVSGEPLNETFVQQGPLVASDNQGMEAVIARQQAGLFGQIK